jgi:hypothetical protein
MGYCHAMRSPRRCAALAVSVTAAVLLSACSDGSAGPAPSSSPGPSGSATPPASGAPSASAAPSPSASAGLAAASADEILAQARQALLAAGSVHAKGSVRSGGAAYKLDLQMVRKLGARGSLSGQGASLGVVRIKNTAYVQLDQDSWRSVTGSAATARQFAGKYLKVTSSSGAAFKPFLALTDVDQVFDTLLEPTGTVTKGAVTTIGGRKVVDLKVDGGRTGDVYVALDGKPYPLRLAYGGVGGQRVDLDGFGRKVTLTAPPASKIAST